MRCVGSHVNGNASRLFIKLFSELLPIIFSRLGTQLVVHRNDRQILKLFLLLKDGCVKAHDCQAQFVVNVDLVDVDFFNMVFFRVFLPGTDSGENRNCQNAHYPGNDHEDEK